MLKHFAEVREHEKEVLQKAVEDRNTFSKVTQENLAQKMEAYKENRGAQMAALNEKFKARVSSFCPVTSGGLHKTELEQRFLFSAPNRTRSWKK